MVPQIFLLFVGHLRVKSLLPLQTQMKEPISMAKFQLQLIGEILGKYHQSSSRQHQTGNNEPLRLTERHYYAYVLKFMVSF